MIGKQVGFLFKVQPIPAMPGFRIAARTIAEMTHLERSASIGK